MSQLRQRRIEGHFISAEMVLAADGTCLHGSELAGAKHCRPMMFGIHHEFHLRGNHLLDILQQLTTHVFGKSHKGRLLPCARLIIHQQHRFRRIRTLVRIAQSAVRTDCRSDGQTLERNSIPASTLNMPRENSLIPHEVNLTVSETLARVNIGATRLQVVAANLLRHHRNRKASHETNKNDREVKSHTSNSSQSMVPECSAAIK